jgi:hypothetical protein
VFCLIWWIYYVKLLLSMCHIWETRGTVVLCTVNDMVNVIVMTGHSSSQTVKENDKIMLQCSYTVYKFLTILSYKNIIKSKSLKKWTNCNIYLQCPCLFTRRLAESLYKSDSEYSCVGNRVTCLYLFYSSSLILVK